MARGIPEAEARRLVVRGFFAELIDTIGVPELRERIAAAIEAELEQVGRAERLPAGLLAVGRCPTSGASAVEVDGEPVAVVARRRRGLRDRTTCARTRRSRCPRARSTATRSSAGCTARASTCVTGQPTGLPATEPVPVYPVKIDGDDVYVAPLPQTRSASVTTLEIRDLHVSRRRQRRRAPGDPARRRPDRPGGRDARHHGPERLRQVDPGLLRSPATPSTPVTGGTVTLDGEDVLAMTVDERARAGLFLAMQYPVEVPGVSVSNFLRTAVTAVRGEAPKLRDFVKELRAAMAALAIDPAFAERNLNEGFSGGEKKRHEILQLELLDPKIAILDETDSGLDIDALKVVSEGVNRFRESRATGCC